MRRPWIDWARGLAVVIMFHAHVIDAWTLASDRRSWWYHQSVRVAGMAAPLFLFLAGLAVVMAADAKVRRGASIAAASRALQRRGWEILGIALLFRFQSWIVNPGSRMTGMLKIDILNVMGPAMVAAAWLWGRTSRDAVRIVVFAALGFVVVGLTPLIRATPLLDAVPDALEWYLRPPPNRGWFALFPWAALLLAGAAVGVVVLQARSAAAERRMAGWFAAGGAAAFAAGLTTSYYPALIPGASFWTTSPSYFVIRIGLMLVILSVSYAWVSRRGADPTRSPVIQMGRTSLFLYWVHVELAYGVLSSPVRGRLPFWGAMGAFVVFTAAMAWLSYAKDRWVGRWRTRPSRRLDLSRA